MFARRWRALRALKPEVWLWLAAQAGVTLLALRFGVEFGVLAFVVAAFVFTWRWPGLIDDREAPTRPD